MTFKRLYLAGRNPAIPVEDFPRQWRSHAKVAASFPSVGVRYLRVQHCTKLESTPSIPGSSNAHAGVALLTMTELLVSKPSEDRQEIRERLRPDEVRVFGDVVSKWSLYTEEVVLKDGPPDNICVMLFLKRRQSISREEFDRHCAGPHADLMLKEAQTCPVLRRYVQDRGLVEPPAGYEFDCVSELWFDNIDDAARFMTDAGYRNGVQADLANFCEVDALVTMATRITYSWSPAAA